MGSQLNKKGAVGLVPLIIIAGLLFYTFTYLDLGALVGYDMVYKQNWGHICCVQEYDYDIVWTRYTDDKTIANCDAYTNECRISIYPDRDPGIGGLSVNYQVCGLDGKNCGSKILAKWTGLWIGSADDYEVVTIKKGQSVKFSPSFLWNANDWSKIKYTLEAKSFYIKGQENGKVYRQESCILNSQLKKRVLQDGLNELQKSGANSCQNYMIDFIATATKTYMYNNQEVICQARQIYNLDKMTFKDGSTKKIQRDKIADVECCPHEANCDEDSFQFVEENVRECSLTSECPNGGNPIAETGTTYVTYNCNSGTCTKSAPQTVECTNTAVCIQKYGPTSVCDLSPAGWGTCKTRTEEIGYCGDGKCESLLGETTNTCEADCGKIDGIPWWLSLFKALQWWHYLILAVLLIILYAWIRPFLKMIPGLRRVAP